MSEITEGTKTAGGLKNPSKTQRPEKPGGSEVKTSNYVDEALPQNIRDLVDRCTIGDSSFSSNEMFIALKFGKLLWNRLHKMSQHYERQSNNFMPNDIRGPMMKQASIDMNHVLRDTLNDM